MHAVQAILSRVILFLLLFTVLSNFAFAEMTVHFIDVGQGGSVFIQKDGKNILYDCGDTFAGPIVTDYLSSLDIDRVDVLIISHAHKDHMGGCSYVLKDFTVGTVYHNGSKAKTGTWKKFLKEIKKAEKVVIIEQDLEIDSIHVMVAYDSRGRRYSKEADNSVLVRITDGKVDVLLTGDCEATCEKEIIQTSEVQSEILNVGHHGSNAASSTEFLKKVRPKIAVVQSGVGNQYGHPTKPVLQRLKQVGATIHRTDLGGAIVVHSDGQTYEVETEK